MSTLTTRLSVTAGLCVGALAPAAGARPDLYSNGPFVTGVTPGGDDLSIVQTSLSCQVYGYNCQLIPTNSRLADDFTVTQPQGWSVSEVVLFLFQTGSGTATPTFTHVNLRIWAGRPGDPGSTVVYGDTSTNLLSGAAWTGCYRASDLTPDNTTRPIFSVEATIAPALHLDSGTYWLDLQASGTIASGPWAVPVTILGLPAAPNANARAFTSAGQWINLRDSGNNAQQELAFLIRGTAGGPPPCFANCDNSTTQPVLNVQDFTCFLNRFAAGDSYGNCDGSTTPPVLNVQDFTCFLNRFAAGCS